MHSHNRHLINENIVLHERNHHVDRKIAQKKIKSISTENRKLYIRFQRFLLIIWTILFFFSFVHVSLRRDAHHNHCTNRHRTIHDDEIVYSLNAANGNHDCICNRAKLRWTHSVWCVRFRAVCIRKHGI